MLFSTCISFFHIVGYSFDWFVKKKKVPNVIGKLHPLSKIWRGWVDNSHMWLMLIVIPSFIFQKMILKGFNQGLFILKETPKWHWQVPITYYLTPFSKELEYQWFLF